MERVLAKSEGNGGRRRVLATTLENEISTDHQIPKSTKRRRREPVVVVEAVLSGEDKGDQLQADPSTTSTTTTTTTTNVASTVKRSSRFRGVSRHRWTGRYEAHLWDKGSWNVAQKKKGKQVYLGAYDEEEAAARAYDLAALKYWGPTTFTNFPVNVSDYEKEIEIMQSVTKEEYLSTLRRKSSGFSRGVSKYRGVARHHHNGRWEARIGRVFGNKYLYLGTYSTQEEAAAAYDIAAIEYRGINAVTNFDLSTYIRWLRPEANAFIASKEPRADGEAVTSSTFLPKEQLPPLIFNYNLYANDDMGSPPKQEYQAGQFAGSTNSASSPRTALSILLRSSIFRELVEKNSNASDDGEVEGDEMKCQQQQLGNGNEFGLAYFDGIAKVPYICPSSTGNTLSSVELQEENAAAYFERPVQSLWSSVLSMSSIQ